jgi:hypothetical protein
VNILAIDTSIAACGVALFRDNQINCNTIRTDADDTAVERCQLIWDKLTNLFYDKSGIRRLDVVLIEYPTFQQSDRGRIAAAGGGLIKIATVAGYLAAKLDSCKQVKFITPSMWKGMLSKDQTRSRIMKHKLLGPQLSLMKFDHNAADAVGMIEWYISRVQKVDFSKAEIIQL